MPTELQKKTYEDIMKLYDFADETLDIAEKYPKGSEPYVQVVEELVETIETNTEVMVDNFLKYAKRGGRLSGIEKLNIEKARDQINKAVDKFLQEVDYE